MTELTPGGHTCHPNTHAFPHIDGKHVATHFATTCSKPDGLSYLWRLEIALFAPGGSDNQRDMTLVGNPVTFDQATTEVKLLCETGKWESQVRLRYRLDAWLSKWKPIYHNSHYIQINCPSP